MLSFRWKQVNWPNSLFLVSTLVLALTGVPLYVACHGLDWFQVVLFFVFFAVTGLSITVSYHRLFAHLTFKARWPVRLFTLVFGGAAVCRTLCLQAERSAPRSPGALYSKHPFRTSGHQSHMNHLQPVGVQ